MSITPDSEEEEAVEFNDEEFERAVANHRYTEIKNMLAKIASSIDNYSGLIKSVNGISASLQKLPSPDPNANRELVSAINKMNQEIKLSIDNLQMSINYMTQPREWEFKIVREPGGYMEKIQAKEIQRKIQAQA